ncbi:MAG: hypothetical protein M0036_04635 [Desulfobacteraceae bacterium]|nr:hypothetical protein [Desulfobacteraceae bacterium]
MSLIELMQAKVKDESGRLTFADDFAPAVEAALLKYSQHKPRELVKDVPGAGTRDVVLPGEWVAEFSQVRRVEYPAGGVPETLLEGWRVYQAPAGPVLRLATEEPTAAELVRVTITVPRLEEEIVVGDVDAVACLAASICCDTLANLFASTNDPTIMADVVNYRSKSGDYARRAKDLRNLFGARLGLDGDGGPPAAITTAPPPTKADGLTHWRS